MERQRCPGSMERSWMSRREFVRLAQAGDIGISRQTGYVYLRRYQAGGDDGLPDRSSRPARSSPAWWTQRPARGRNAGGRSDPRAAGRGDKLRLDNRNFQRGLRPSDVSTWPRNDHPQHGKCGRTQYSMSQPKNPGPSAGRSTGTAITETQRHRGRAVSTRGGASWHGSGHPPYRGQPGLCVSVSLWLLALGGKIHKDPGPLAGRSSGTGVSRPIREFAPEARIRTCQEGLRTCVRVDSGLYRHTRP
jgi:hypothetical protein